MLYRDILRASRAFTWANEDGKKWEVGQFFFESLCVYALNGFNDERLRQTFLKERVRGVSLRTTEILKIRKRLHVYCI